MISIRPEEDYDCVYVELQDPTSRVQIHLHVRPATRDMARRELRQIEVSSKADTVFAMNNVTDKLPCDPHGLGDSNVYSRDNYVNREEREQDDDRKVAEDDSYLHDEPV